MIEARFKNISRVIAEEFENAMDDANMYLREKNYRMSAGEIAEALGVSPQSLSYHLKLLKESDLLIESREKNFVYYELNASLFDELILWLKQF